MLRIHVGPLEGQIKRPDHYFDRNYLPEWFEDPFVQEICLRIDKTVVHSAYQMENPIFGAVNCTVLSTGCKNTILAYKTDKIIPATHMGDNCAPLLVEISKQKELVITLEYLMDFSDIADFKAEIMNTNKIVSSVQDYVLEVGELL